jgi:GntR family phosphonate transport system transcriptional regulator
MLKEGVSRWRQVRDAIAAEIEGGMLCPDERLPPSTELAARFGVNRHTVLRAVALLQNEGFVRVERGRGTYVVVNPLRYRLGQQQWFEQNLLEHNLTPSRTVISVIELPTPPEVAVALQVKPGSKSTLVTLLGEADGFPVNFGYHYFPSERLPGVAAAFRCFGSERTTMLSFPSLFRSLGVNAFRRKTIRVRSRVPTPEEARQLKMASSDHVLVTEVTNVNASDVPIVHAFTCFCSSRVELVLDP